MADDILLRILNSLSYQPPQVEKPEKVKEITPRPEVVHEGSSASKGRVREEKKEQKKGKDKERKEDEEGVDIVI